MGKKKAKDWVTDRFKTVSTDYQISLALMYMVIYYLYGYKIEGYHLHLTQYIHVFIDLFLAIYCKIQSWKSFKDIFWKNYNLYAFIEISLNIIRNTLCLSFTQYVYVMCKVYVIHNLPWSVEPENNTLSDHTLIVINNVTWMLWIDKKYRLLPVMSMCKLL